MNNTYIPDNEIDQEIEFLTNHIKDLQRDLNQLKKRRSNLDSSLLQEISIDNPN